MLWILFQLIFYLCNTTTTSLPQYNFITIKAIPLPPPCHKYVFPPSGSGNRRFSAGRSLHNICRSSTYCSLWLGYFSLF